MIDLTEEQIERYSRHILLQDLGLEGQEKLLNAKVLIVGVGGLGSPVDIYLAAAGVGHIGIVDADVVDLSNLQRQVIHQTKDLNTPKVESAKEKMIAIVAPSILAQFSAPVESVYGAIKAMGFEEIVEVAQGAMETTRREAEELKEKLEEGQPFMTTSCCPSYVQLAEKHIPDLKKYISSTGSPVRGFSLM